VAPVASKHITRSVSQVIAQVPAVVQAVSGVNLNDLLGHLRPTQRNESDAELGNDGRDLHP
jgi:hypothetical protein